MTAILKVPTHHQPPYTPLHKHKTLPFISKHKSRMNKRVRKVLCFVFILYIFCFIFVHNYSKTFICILLYGGKNTRQKKLFPVASSASTKKNIFFCNALAGFCCHVFAAAYQSSLVYYYCHQLKYSKRNKKFYQSPRGLHIMRKILHSSSFLHFYKNRFAR